MSQAAETVAKWWDSLVLGLIWLVREAVPYLRNRAKVKAEEESIAVKTMHEALEEVRGMKEEWKNKFEALEEKYQQMEERYLRRIGELEAELNAAEARILELERATGSVRIPNIGALDPP